MTRYFQHVFMLFPLSFGYLFYDTYSYFCNKCCIDHLLCMVGVFRLSGTTDYCNFCYHWRQNLAMGTEVLIFELQFFYGRGTCFTAMVMAAGGILFHKHISFNLKSTPVDKLEDFFTNCKNSETIPPKCDCFVDQWRHGTQAIQNSDGCLVYIFPF